VLFGAVVEAPPVPVVLPFEDEPGVEPLAAEPPDVELAPAVAPPACASAKVLESANAVANAIVVSFMGRFLGYWPRISRHERLMFQLFFSAIESTKPLALEYSRGANRLPSRVIRLFRSWINASTD
jgi:hypothetical protein